MEIFPAMSAVSFEQLEPGDLFLNLEGSVPFYALRTQQSGTNDSTALVVLGPSFPETIDEAFLLSWKPHTVISFGKDFTILPSLNPAHWSVNGADRSPVCLAMVADKAYICSNGGSSTRHYHYSRNICFI
jgi:hypothetical protein